MVNICFIILNYNLYKETMACVQSIKKRIDTDSFRIIIVDNASPNGSGEKLKELYLNDKIVEVILLPENIGFAKGNNVGINKAREEGAKFICCINDDAELITDSFFSLVEEKYEVYHPALIGPRVINRYGQEDSFFHPLRTIEEYEQTLLKWKTESYRQFKKRKGRTIKYRLRLHIDGNRFTRKVYQKLKLGLTGMDPYEANSLVSKEDAFDLVMTGCCLIFTPVFFDYLDGFNDSTFLYWEEEYLVVDLFLHGLHTLYVPEIGIWHKEGIATSTVAGKKAEKKWIFMKKHYTESLQLFINYLKAHEKEIYRDELRG